MLKLSPYLKTRKSSVEPTSWKPLVLRGGKTWTGNQSGEKSSDFNEEFTMQRRLVILAKPINSRKSLLNPDMPHCWQLAK
jgi:hypothetical protein